MGMFIFIIFLAILFAIVSIISAKTKLNKDIAEENGIEEEKVDKLFTKAKEGEFKMFKDKDYVDKI